MNLKKMNIILLGILLLACGRANEPTEKEASAVIANQLALLPEQTNLLIYANLQAFKQTPFGNQLSTEFDRRTRLDREDEDYREFIEQTGIVPERDIYEIWISGFADESHHDKNKGGAVVRGQFNKEKIVGYFESKHRRDAREETFQDHKIYISRNRHDEDFAFTFLNSETVAVGGEYWLKNVIEQSQKSGRSVLQNEAMAKYLDAIPQKKYLWGIVDMDGLHEHWAEAIRKGGSHYQAAKPLENMDHLIFYTEVGEKANLFLKGQFTNAEEAQTVADMLNGFKAMAKMFVSEDREAVDMLNEITIRTEGSFLHVSIKMGGDFLDKWEQKRKKFEKIEL